MAARTGTRALRHLGHHCEPISAYGGQMNRLRGSLWSVGDCLRPELCLSGCLITSLSIAGRAKAVTIMPTFDSAARLTLIKLAGPTTNRHSRVMQPRMSGLGKQHQIFETVIGLVARNVVNVLAPMQLTAEMLFHHVAMLQHPAPVRELHSNIAINCQGPTAVPASGFRPGLIFAVAALRTVSPAPGRDRATKLYERLAAIVADAFDRIVAGHVRLGAHGDSTSLCRAGTVASGAQHSYFNTPILTQNRMWTRITTVKTAVCV